MELNKTNHGKALRELLDEEMEKINDITTCTSWDETIGRKHSMLLIRKIFSFMDKKEATKKHKNNYT